MRHLTMILLFATVAMAEDETTPARVTLHADNGDAIVDVRALEERQEVADAADGLGTGFDALQVSLLVPLGTCDELADCTAAIEDACSIAGRGKAKKSELKAGGCEGSCWDGQVETKVIVVCVGEAQ